VPGVTVMWRAPEMLPKPMTQTLSIPMRFSGPPGSANGGYTCGRVAGLMEAEEVEVSLRSPPPLEQPLSVTHDGKRVTIHDGDTLVAEGGPAQLLLDVPDAVPADEVAQAQESGSERWTAEHPFPTCFVCGPRREAGDGLEIFPVELPGRNGLFAATWTPDESVSDGHGGVRPESVWAALDCPTSAPVANYTDGPPIVLAKLTARLGCPLRVGETHTILSWELERDGRKREAAAALYDSEGRMLCASQALWIELRD
jgi:hypothetical protein